MQYQSLVCVEHCYIFHVCSFYVYLFFVSPLFFSFMFVHMLSYSVTSECIYAVCHTILDSRFVCTSMGYNSVVHTMHILCRGFYPYQMTILLKLLTMYYCTLSRHTCNCSVNLRLTCLCVMYKHFS